MREIFQMVPEGIVICDLKGKIIFLNNKLLNYCGITEQNWLDKPLAELISGYEPIAQFKILRKKGCILSELRFKSKISKGKAIAALSIALKDEEQILGQVFICRLFNQDLSENLYSDKNNPIIKILNAKKEEAWYIFDFQKLLTYFCSESIELVCGWTAQEFKIGAWALSFICIHPRDRNRVMETLSKEVSFRNEAKIIHDHIPIKIRFRMLSKEGNWIWIDDSLTVLDRDDSGMINYMIGTIRRIDPATKDDNLSNLKLIEDNLIQKDGKMYVSIDTLLEIQKNNILNNESSSKILVDSFHLTNRELEILSHIVNGLSSEQISAVVHITKNTVNMHRKQIMKKMQANNLADLVRKSIESGLFPKNV